MLSHDVDSSTMVSIKGPREDALQWADVVVAEVGGKRKLVKLYYESSGGEKAFLRDLQRYGKSV